MRPQSLGVEIRGTGREQKGNRGTWEERGKEGDQKDNQPLDVEIGGRGRGEGNRGGTGEQRKKGNRGGNQQGQLRETNLQVLKLGE